MSELSKLKHPSSEKALSCLDEPSAERDSSSVQHEKKNTAISKRIRFDILEVAAFIVVKKKEFVDVSVRCSNLPLEQLDS